MFQICVTFIGIVFVIIRQILKTYGYITYGFGIVCPS